jgi:hypothetical protein
MKLKKIGLHLFKKLVKYSVHLFVHSSYSASIGSDLMFEILDAFIHIEVKTTTVSNPADFKGKIQIAQNQTS